MGQDTRKQVLGKLIYGLHVVTAMPDDGPAVAATVTWLSQASVNQPLLMVALRRGSRLLRAVVEAGAFVVHLLETGQRELAATFFKPAVFADGRLSGYSFTRGPTTGAPVLDDVPAWMELEVKESIERGDHTIVLGEVVNIALAMPDFEPLALRDTPWKYGR